MSRFSIGDPVIYKGKKAIIADHLKGTYCLWDHTGKKELTVNGKVVEWVPASDLCKR